MNSSHVIRFSEKITPAPEPRRQFGAGPVKPCLDCALWTVHHLRNLGQTQPVLIEQDKAGPVFVAKILQDQLNLFGDFASLRVDVSRVVTAQIGL